MITGKRLREHNHLNMQKKIKCNLLYSIGNYNFFFAIISIHFYASHNANPTLSLKR